MILSLSLSIDYNMEDMTSPWHKGTAHPAAYLLSGTENSCAIYVKVYASRGCVAD